MGLTKARALGDLPGMTEAIGDYVARNKGHICEVCGLQAMGHNPESRWLGYDAHDWQPIPATADQVRRADNLTREAYRIKYHAA